MNRRRFLHLSPVLASVLLAPSLAHAGSYLDRAALLLEHAHREADYLRARLSDKDLAEVTHQLATARVETARRMQVPKEVAQAHPHLLLCLERYERATDAALSGATARFLEHQRQAREEDRIFRGILSQLGWSLPKVR